MAEIDRDSDFDRKLLKAIQKENEIGHVLVPIIGCLTVIAFLMLVFMVCMHYDVCTYK